eukprot:357120-Chlamydomonas_euryale.AAC.3
MRKLVPTTLTTPLHIFVFPLRDLTPLHEVFRRYGDGNTAFEKLAGIKDLVRSDGATLEVWRSVPVDADEGTAARERGTTVRSLRQLLDRSKSKEEAVVMMCLPSGHPSVETLVEGRRGVTHARAQIVHHRRADADADDWSFIRTADI